MGACVEGPGNPRKKWKKGFRPESPKGLDPNGPLKGEFGVADVLASVRVEIPTTAERLRATISR
jgi:hypothetical protein